MTQAKSRFKSIKEYLEYDDDTDTRSELVDGVLVEMGAENDINQEIAVFLVSVLLQFVPYYLLRRGTEIVVSSRRVTTRVPDLMVMSEETRNAMKRNERSMITAEMPAPLLVVEVVSPGEPGEENYDRDYVDKRTEYASRGISEYWLIDPIRAVVIVLSRDGDRYYEIGQFRNRDRVVSPTFPELQVTAEQILKAGL